MRLSPEQIKVIKQIGQQVLGEGTRVVLFGSRVSDSALGGTLIGIARQTSPFREEG